MAFARAEAEGREAPGERVRSERAARRGAWRGVDAGRDQDVRRCLHRLADAAAAGDWAAVLLRHLTKAGPRKALYRGGGSIGIIGACRVALLLTRDPADEVYRVLAMNKCNLTARPPSLAMAAAVIVRDSTSAL